ncbi:alpha/beta hydrolase [Roseofilum sp. BLCC_M91]|uniref:Alpha/beta hydrolase n=1 Tax=Roseofilum halophilum BLCC-M91 TaxID=3022259 RepID=A0ABT7BK94_9CYAN|nr:alpha/beta hydrolase [Roseofilum halophilum]MDJ1178911.1 alpha/beta hydrolase [Roseofilum halophilum BLCC-M91]
MKIQSILLRIFYGLFLFGLSFLTGLARPAHSAEKIYFTYGPLEFAMSVDSLDRFAKTGEITSDFQFYAKFMKPEDLNELQQLLQQQFNLSAVAVSQMTYTAMGEEVLKRLGYLVQTQKRQNGFYALRSALILAADDPEGLTLVNIMRYFPSQGIRINTRVIFELQNLLATFFQYRNSVVKTITEQANAEAIANPIPDTLPDILQPGPFRVRKQTLIVKTREFLESDIDLYLPENQEKPAPLIVISHGFGSTRSNFVDSATYLASYGFAVAIPEHIGSNLVYRQALLEGWLNTEIYPDEFVDRPYDIKKMLDELETLQAEGVTWAQGINVQNVGILGHSLGATTALSLAGAELNRERLREKCTLENPMLNVSVLLQCRANSIDVDEYQLHDPRVQAAIAVYPLSSVIFGPEQIGNIDIPTLLMASSHDIVTPVVTEQIYPFLWLQHPEKYLALMVPGSHFSVSAPTENNNPFTPESAQEKPRDNTLGINAMKSLSLAFLKVHLHQDDSYLPYLSASYAQTLNGETLQLNLIRSLEVEQLEQTYGQELPLPVFEVMSNE